MVAKVLVSGCFDLLHSGHVEFFRAAAQHGELYVRIGSDANIMALKHHRPMYSEKERLFLVKNLKCVHDAAVSAGSGMFDFATDMDLIKPEVYFVNEDASQLDKRREICKEKGIKMIIAPRTPSEGLEERSSTDMKKRMAEYSEKEQEELMAKGVPAFHREFPWRLCFAGGWLDLDWCNKYVASSCIVTINIKFNPDICRDRCGLATSSRKHAIKLWQGRVPKHLTPADAAHYLWGAENTDHYGRGSQPYVAGNQDQCGLFFPGISKWVYEGGAKGTMWPTRRITLCDAKDPAQAKIFSWLESVLHIVDIPFVSRPEDYDSQRINYLTDDNIPVFTKVAMVKALADASERAWTAIMDMDCTALGKALTDTQNAWGEALPYTVDPYRTSAVFAGDPVKSAELAFFLEKYKHTKGFLFSGAGGGFLMVIDDKPVENSFKIKINTDPIVQPVKSHSVGDPPSDFWKLT